MPVVRCDRNRVKVDHTVAAFRADAQMRNVFCRRTHQLACYGVCRKDISAYDDYIERLGLAGARPHPFHTHRTVDDRKMRAEHRGHISDGYVDRFFVVPFDWRQHMQFYLATPPETAFHVLDSQCHAGVHVHLHDREGHDKIVFKHFRADLKRIDRDTIGDRHLDEAAGIHVYQEAIALMRDQCNTTGVKGFLGLDTQYRTFTDSYIRPCFPERVDSSSDDLRVCGYACFRRSNPADIGLEQYSFPPGW